MDGQSELVAGNGKKERIKPVFPDEKRDEELVLRQARKKGWRTTELISALVSPRGKRRKKGGGGSVSALVLRTQQKKKRNTNTTLAPARGKNRGCSDAHAR